MGLASRVRMFLLEGGYAPLAELECSLGLMGLAKKRTSCQLTPLRGKSSATYPTQLKTHALARAVCMCKNEQERTRMHRCDLPC